MKHFFQVSSRKLPERRSRQEEPELAFEEPERVPEGKASLIQIHEFINEYYVNSDQYKARDIAEQYKVDSAVVEQVLKYFLPLELKVKMSEEMKKDHKKLAKEFGRQGIMLDKAEIITDDSDMKKLEPGKT